MTLTQEGGVRKKQNKTKVKTKQKQTTLSRFRHNRSDTINNTIES